MIIEASAHMVALASPASAAGPKWWTISQTLNL